ncbi:MAG: hypothetical protein HXS45_13935 [Theionarchaea archaeon]|nr:hypothetical protein [Theionarchaea archaeon]
MGNRNVAFTVVAIILVLGCISQQQSSEEQVLQYAEGKGFSQEIHDSLEVLGSDGEFNKDEKAFIDIMASLSTSLQDILIKSILLKDGTIDEDELEFLRKSLEMGDLTQPVLQSTLLQRPIDPDSITLLNSIRAFADMSPEMTETYLKTYYSKLSSIQSPVGEASSIHRSAWEMVIQRAQEDPSYACRFYATRTLSVKHPEIYLQADGLFIEIITTSRGFKRAFEIKDVHSEDLYTRTYESPPFSFDDIDFSTYTVIGFRAEYPQEYPVFSYLDRRLLPIASTLKSSDTRLTQLEKGVQAYFAGRGEKEMYLVYCDNENTYLCNGDTIIWATTLEPAEQIGGNPILIFNEEHVWYPLMERDDTDKDELLKALVNACATEVTVPPLEEDELAFLDELKRITGLPSHLGEDMALLSALRPVWNLEKYIETDIYERVEESGIDFIAERRFLLKQANYLSPITAYLAAMAETREGEDKMVEVSREYLKHATTGDMRIVAHGHTWFCDLVEQTVEESYTTKAGHCIVQAATISAALDLAHIEYYWVEGFAEQSVSGPNAHDWLCIPACGGTVSNGLYLPGKRLLLNRIDFVADNDTWVYIRELERWVGTASPGELIAMLRRLDDFYEKEIYIREVGSTYIYLGARSIPLKDFVALLERD